MQWHASSYNQSFSLYSRAKQWVRAVAGLAAVVCGLLVAGAIVGTTTNSGFLISIGLATPEYDQSGSLAKFMAHLHREFPDAISVQQQDSDLGGLFPLCRPSAAPMQILVESSRLSFSRKFRRIPVYARESGIELCGIAYSRVDSISASASRSIALGTAPTALAVLALLLYWRSGRGAQPWAQGSLPASRAIGTGSVIGILLAAGMSLLAHGAQVLGLQIPAQPSLSTSGFVAVSLVIVQSLVLAPIVEEFGFRAWFLSQATPAVGAPIAVLVSSLAFSAIHFPEVPVQALGYFLFSAAMAIVWYRSRSLLVCVVAHACHNSLIMLVIAS